MAVEPAIEAIRRKMDQRTADSKARLAQQRLIAEAQFGLQEIQAQRGTDIASSDVTMAENMLKAKREQEAEAQKAKAQGKPAPPPVPAVGDLGAGQNDQSQAGRPGGIGMGPDGLRPDLMNAAAQTAGQGQTGAAPAPGGPPDPGGNDPSFGTTREVPNNFGQFGNIIASLFDEFGGTQFSTRPQTSFPSQFEQQQAKLMAERASERHKQDSDAAKITMMNEFVNTIGDKEGGRVSQLYLKEGAGPAMNALAELQAQGRTTKQETQRLELKGIELQHTNMRASTEAQRATRRAQEIAGNRGSLAFDQEQKEVARRNRLDGQGVSPSIRDMTGLQLASVREEVASQFGEVAFKDVMHSNPGAVNTLVQSHLVFTSDSNGLNGKAIFFRGGKGWFSSENQDEIETQVTSALISGIMTPQDNGGVDRRRLAATAILGSTGLDYEINDEGQVTFNESSYGGDNRNGQGAVLGAAAAYTNARPELSKTSPRTFLSFNQALARAGALPKVKGKEAAVLPVISPERFAQERQQAEQFARERAQREFAPGKSKPGSRPGFSIEPEKAPPGVLDNLINSLNQ